MTTFRTEAGRQLFHDNRDGMVILSDAMRSRILAIEAEAASGPALTRTEVRRVITNAYYGARNEGETMETAADRAADAVMALAPGAAEPSDEALRLLRDLYDASMRYRDAKGLTSGEVGILATTQREARAYLAAHPGPSE